MRFIKTLPLALALLLASCGGDGGGFTQTILFVNSDLTVPSELGVIDVVIQAPNLNTRTASAALGFGQAALPRTLAIVHGAGELGPYRVELTAKAPDGSSLNISRTVFFTMQRNQTQRIEVVLQRACIDVVCGSGLTCDAGVCVDPTVGGTTISTQDMGVSTGDAGP